MSSTPEGFVDAPAYLQVEPVRGSGWRGSTYVQDLVRGAKVVGVTQSRPNQPRRGTITVKVTLRIPGRAFDPLQPEAVVVVPADLTDPHPVAVEAQDAREAS